MHVARNNFSRVKVARSSLKAGQAFALLASTVATWLITIINLFLEPNSWSSGNAFVSGAIGLRFKSWAGQIGHAVLPTLATALFRGELLCF